ncbi:hypothetical protein NZD88_01220 [Chryseobacterium antibioticum]|uniref:Uncharacterized protein n=1 Tax=Chryseobacterium pyrolae TaxID=2987481 RepID=A0ABT2IC26_9FLAO|nr:hypothetical protein [Chryseobacterium pyrolae]MCT2406173.1 hypothetical protein [Chryseobacterium pyrolae]
MQDAKNQSYISDANGCDCNNFFRRADMVPKCQVHSNISQVQQVVTSEKYPVDSKAHLLIMKEVFQIGLSGLKASSSHIYSNVRADRKENEV